MSSHADFAPSRFSERVLRCWSGSNIDAPKAKKTRTRSTGCATTPICAKAPSNLSRPADFAISSTKTSNVWIIGMFIDGELASSIRLHVADREDAPMPADGVSRNSWAEAAPGSGHRRSHEVRHPSGFFAPVSRNALSDCAAGLDGRRIFPRRLHPRDDPHRASRLLSARVRTRGLVAGQRLSDAEETDRLHGARLFRDEGPRRSSAIHSTIDGAERAEAVRALIQSDGRAGDAGGHLGFPRSTPRGEGWIWQTRDAIASAPATNRPRPPLRRPHCRCSQGARRSVGGSPSGARASPRTSRRRPGAPPLQTLARPGCRRPHRETERGARIELIVERHQPGDALHHLLAVAPNRAPASEGRIRRRRFAPRNWASRPAWRQPRRRGAATRRRRRGRADR